MPRSCGGCTACCSVFEVPSLVPPKPEWARCPHLGAHGCACYDTRPEECKRFVCLWLGGSFSVAARPDRSGVLWLVRPPAAEGPYQGEALPAAAELRKGALDAPAGKRMLTAVLPEHDVILYSAAHTAILQVDRTTGAVTLHRLR
jgi:hypothetical protein